MRASISTGIACLALVVLAHGASGQAPVATPVPAFVVIVHPQHPQGAISKKFIASAFLKKTTRWPDGSAIRPVDLRPDNAARRRFSSEVIGRSVAAVRSYWQQAIFSGRDIPPLVLAREEDVVAYVLRTPGAIGYVSGRTPLGAARVVAY